MQGRKRIVTSTENDRPGAPLTVTPRHGLAHYTAVVLAGAASIGLTAAAGAYIVHQLPGGAPDAPLARPAAPAPAEPQPVHRLATPRLATDGPVVAAALFDRRATAVSGPPALRQETAPPVADPEPAAAPSVPTAARPEPAFDRTVRVGRAYLGATVGEAESGAVTVTFDTNATFAALTGRRNDPGATGVTTLRTEIGTGGDVTVTFSDPTLGEHDLRVNGPQEPGARPAVPTTT